MFWNCMVMFISLSEIKYSNFNNTTILYNIKISNFKHTITELKKW